MPFNPAQSESINFNPSDSTSGGNVLGGTIFGCNNTADRERIQQYWEDLNKQYGLDVQYWRNGYDLEEHDALYGEHPTSKFNGPRPLRSLVNIENQSVILSKFGIVTDTDIQFYIPISEFERAWGTDTVPNRGDLIEVTDEACDRPERQRPKVFQVTDKRDNVEVGIDLFAGHYVWYLEAKRYEYSYEENGPDEGGEPITNSDFVGIMNGSNQEESEEISYGPSADEESKEDLDNTENSGVYGGYL